MMPGRSTKLRETAPAPVAEDPSRAQHVRIAQLAAMRGCLPGLRQPAAIVDFQLLAPAPAAIVEAHARIFEAAFDELPSLPAFPEFASRADLASVARGTLAMLQVARWPLFDSLAILRPTGLAADTVRLVFPSLHDRALGVSLALEAAVKLLHNLAAATADLDESSAIASLEEQLKNIRALAPSGMNTPNFLAAAHDLGIPWARVARNIYQFGWGAKARLLHSSFTDETPVIGANIARDKRLASIVLRRSGLPAPEHFDVTSEEAALEAARQLGFPVVVKPADRDGGNGVFTFLESPVAVSAAFAKASAFSPNLIVQKHILGNDYRLQAFQGEVFWATHRKPAGVTGDGVHSVRDLVKITNADPMRGPVDSPQLKWIILDAETDAWLARQGLEPDSVPDKGRFVRLRGAANITMGGTIEPVLDIAHPDNLALAVRAARILRLDLAGVDLLIPDIRRSWREGGASICEVNAQPEMSSHLPAQLLPKLVRGQGRIPVMVVIGGDLEAPHCKALFDGLERLGEGMGIGAREARVSGAVVSGGSLDSFDLAQCLLSDPAVRAIALHVQDSGLFGTGLPFDRIDHLAIAGPVRSKGELDWARTNALANWMKPVCRKIWFLEDASRSSDARVGQLAAQGICAPAHAIVEHFARDFERGDDA